MIDRLIDCRGTNFVTDPTWGDNGKGKVVDVMAQNAEMVIRTNGGANAGHTVTNEHGEFKFHLMPSGIFNPNAICILADTVVVNPTILAKEVSDLRSKGIEVTNKNLLVSKNAHIVMPWHINRDNLRERARGGNKIGTTGQGIGPTYSDRSERTGLRMQDLLEPNFEEKFNKELVWQEKLARLMVDSDESQYNREKILEDLYSAREIIGSLVTSVLPIIYEYHNNSRRILGEAGQGMLLDLDRGSYPNVTSSHPGIAGFNLATGISPFEMNRVVAVTKAYATRVGEGPLPTELKDEIGDRIRAKGHEFGTTTGRPRRCGWLDIPALRYGLRAAGANSLALTKIDIFDRFSEVKICVAYEVGGRVYSELPTGDVEFMLAAKPLYETFVGWKQRTSGVTNFTDLPYQAKEFVNRIQDLVKVPIEMVSVGPERDSTIYP